MDCWTYCTSTTPAWDPSHKPCPLCWPILLSCCLEVCTIRRPLPSSNSSRKPLSWSTCSGGGKRSRGDLITPYQFYVCSQRWSRTWSGNKAESRVKLLLPPYIDSLPIDFEDVAPPTQLTQEQLSQVDLCSTYAVCGRGEGRGIKGIYCARFSSGLRVLPHPQLHQVT